MPQEELYYLGLKALIRNDQGELLMLEISRGGQTYFDIPGGRANRGERLLDALKREIAEETGITQFTAEPQLLRTIVTDIRKIITPQRDAGLVLSLYRCKVVLPETIQTEPHMRAFWCSKEEALRNLATFLPDSLDDIAAVL